MDSKIGLNKRKSEQLKVRITEGFLVELVEEYPQGMKNGSNKREVGTSAGSNKRESTVPYLKISWLRSTITEWFIVSLWFI